MTWSFISIIAPLDPSHIETTRNIIENELGNPVHNRIRDRLSQIESSNSIHFASLHAFANPDTQQAHILFEATVDGDERSAILRLSKDLHAPLCAIFGHATDWKSNTDLAGYLAQHRIRAGHGLFDLPGLSFTGTPGMSVDQIRKEAMLRRILEEEIAQLPTGLSPFEKVQFLRDHIAKKRDFEWALHKLPVTKQIDTDSSKANTRSPLILPMIKTYLWPLLLLLIFIGGAAFFTGDDIIKTAHLLFWGLFGIALFSISFFALLRTKLLAQEKTDWVNVQRLHDTERHAINARENRFGVQNHMISITMRKPGWVRWFTQRISFFIIAVLNPLNGRPGFLGTIGTIHSARWITVPGSRALIFLSNYDGSFESYLEDFITKEHHGLTSVWSNTIGFPKTVGLFEKGAQDAEGFKRFTRNSMIRTSFWFSAYPELSTDVIRANNRIRRGLVFAESDDEAAALLAQFGSSARDPKALETDEIQSLLFGGMGYMPESLCILVDLPENLEKSRIWLSTVRPHLAFGEAKYPGKALAQLAFSPTALKKLGLDENCLNQFPAAFRDSMIGAGRDRILGDPDERQRKSQFWWGAEHTPDAAIMLFARDKKALKALRKTILDAGGTEVITIPLAPLSLDRGLQVEPFGFVDGISQPAISGTARARKLGDPLHIMQAGELIIGYPDNRGNTVCGPMMDHHTDPHQSLPTNTRAWDFGQATEHQPRDIGRNGSFLVLRHLEQHVDRFNAFCSEAAQHVKHRFETPDKIDGEYIAAKMVGRWKNGGPLVRWPDQPPKHNGPYDNDFLFGDEDPQGQSCPYGAHIRRANPRDSRAPRQETEITISNRHRILRVGRSYAPQKGQDPGILFMCLNADIERQFEFIQQTWLNSGHFHGLHNENDPTIGNGKARNFTIPAANGPVILKSLPDFVTTRGGGYFFLPGKRLLTYFLKT